jgi:nitrate reductase NapE component
MDINWILVGWIIDVVLNGIVWLIIAAFLIPIIEVSDKWTRKAITFMDKADKWIRKVLENSFEWMQKKNLNILFAFLFVILFGLLAQYEVILDSGTIGLIFKSSI